MFFVKKVLDALVREIANTLGDLPYKKCVKVASEEFGYEYTPPANIKNISKKEIDFFSNILVENSTLPIRHVYLYNNAYIDSNGVVFKNLKIALPSLTHFSRKYYYNDTFLLKQWANKSIKIFMPGYSKEMLAVIYDANSANNYYHWMIEACSRIMLLKEKYPNCYLLVSSPIPEYVAVTTKLLGYDKLFEIENRSMVKASNVLVVERASDPKEYYSSHQDVSIIKNIQSKIIAGLGVENTIPSRRIYISRSRQKYRRVINENDLEYMLCKYGFETVYYEDLSFEDQVIISNQASVIIGSHGANLTNMLFMQPGKNVLELIKEDNFNTVYFRLASYLKLNYYRISCKLYQVSGTHDDVTVDIDLLEKVLQKIL